MGKDMTNFASKQASSFIRVNRAQKNWREDSGIELKKIEGMEEPLKHHAAIESNILVTQGGHSISNNLVDLLNELWCCIETIVVFASVPFTPNTVDHGLE
ncbi:hypothetical protein HID58_091275 [Brassica napus]|uniref:Uncharacterized protein n=3 Tax=Brassica TaxID=3705 RepID=A0ABQ7X2Q8_BRANA|nr:hypothetical protein HID58_091275 [Brassica napus]CAG7875273.1 unnamed protein product [Brassica rapa]CDY08252.1 BnaA05g13670D [Brassica napus]VDC70920.1 unnamed protein product [Brassica rapa]